MPSLYLSRLTLNPLKREAQRDLADCHNMHRRLLSAFPDLAEVEHARERFGVLYRVEQVRERIMILAQSQEKPDWGRLPEGYLACAAEVKSLDALYDSVRPDMELIFRIQANPTRRISGRNTDQPAAWRGKRVELNREDDQLDWLRRKGEKCGFLLVSLRARPAGLPDARRVWTGNAAQAPSAATTVSAGEAVSDTRMRPGGSVGGHRVGTGKLTFGSVTFEGRLRVTDSALFRSALEQGIGSGKAYGFGLLSIAPAPRD